MAWLYRAAGLFGVGLTIYGYVNGDAMLTFLGVAVLLVAVSILYYG